jgi:hypothetical protein
MKISEDISNSKAEVFNVKKLISDGVDLTLRRSVEKKGIERNERPVSRI